MQTLFIVFKEDKIYLEIKSIGTRLCYLLSRKVLLAGSLHQLFSMDDFLNKAKVESQLDFLIDNSEIIPPELLEAAKRCKKLNKESKKVKYPTREMIASKRSVEAMLQPWYKKTVWEYLAPVRDGGMLELKNILNKPSFGFYNIQHALPEKRQHSEDSLLSEILQFQLDEDDLGLPTFLFVSNVIFEEQFTTTIHEAVPVGKYSKHGFFAEIFTLPDYSFFSVAQMDAIRNSISIPLQLFQEAAGNFAGMVAEPEKAFNYLQSEVTAAAAALQATHDANTIVGDFKVTILQDYLHIQLCMGLLPAYHVYSSFKYTDTMTPETEKILIAAGEANKILPVMAIKMTAKAGHPGVVKDTTEQQALPLKKSLSID